MTKRPKRQCSYEIVNLEDEKEIDRLFKENEMTYSTIQVKKIKNEIAKECAKDFSKEFNNTDEKIKNKIKNIHYL